MKHSHLIISQIKQIPFFAKLKEMDDISKLIYSLNLDVRKYIAFAHKKEHILFIALKNPNLCREFNTYTAPILLEIITSLHKELPHLEKIREIKAYYPQVLQKTKPQETLSQNTTTHGGRRQILSPSQKRDSLRFKPPKHFASYSEQTQITFLQTYQERCKGDFKNLASNPKLHQIFEKIRKSIKQNNA